MGITALFQVISFKDVVTQVSFKEIIIDFFLILEYDKRYEAKKYLPPNDGIKENEDDGAFECGSALWRSFI